MTVPPPLIDHVCDRPSTTERPCSRAQVLRGEGAVKLQVTLDDAPTRQQMQIPPALLQQLERQRTPDFYEDP